MTRAQDGQKPQSGNRISIPLPQEWLDQREALAAYRTQRAALLQTWQENGAEPDEALLRQARTALAAPARRIPLTDTEAAQAATLQQAVAAAAQRQDGLAYSRALAALLLLQTPPQIGTFAPNLLQPWLASLLATALNEPALLSIGDDNASAAQALDWCMAFAAAMQQAHESGQLPGGAIAWTGQWLPLLGFDITAINFYSTDLNLRAYTAAFGALRAAAFAVTPPFGDGPLRLYGELAEQKPDQRTRLALFCSHPSAHGHGLPHIIWWLACLDRTRYEPVLVLRQIPENVQILEKFLQRYPNLQDYAPVIIVNDANLTELRRYHFDLLYNFDDLCRGRSERPGYTKLAARQVTAFYTPATTGCATMDYFITSRALDPLVDEAFNEQPILTEGLSFCFHYESYFGVKPLWCQRDADLPQDAVLYTMGSSMLTKLRPEFIDVLLTIMQQVPNSYCVAMPAARPKDRLHLTEYLLRACARHAVDPARFRFYPVTSRNLLHGLLTASDVFLDFFPFSGTNNLMDPIATATPCVTFCPNPGYSRNRIGGVILRELGLGGLVTETVADYIALAVKLGTDAALRDRWRARMGRTVLEEGPLCDGPAFVARMERAFEEILAAPQQAEARYA